LLPPADFWLTGNACRALTSDHAINNRQLNSAGQAAFESALKRRFGT
jgi:hypothetical protein